MAADPRPGPQTLSGDPIVEEARRFFNRAAEWEADARGRFVEDVKFANGDSDNGYQWPNSLRRQRDIDDRPCLTMNVVRQHNLQIINQAAQAKSQIKVLPLGGGATAESAGIVRQLIRHVEYQSNAPDAYKIAREFQVDGGIGWWRIVTDYASPDTFDQEIFIREVWDPLAVYMDPDCQRLDCSDAKQALVFDTRVPREHFENAYPDWAEAANTSPLGVTSVGGDSTEQDHVMVAEYFRKVPEPDELISFVFEGERVNVRKSNLPARVSREVLASPETRTRPVSVDKVEWYLIAGEQIIDQTEWLGSFIPLIRCLGRQTIIEGRLDRKGHTRAMKSAQHMYNWSASNQVEFGATQGKTPWIAAAKAIEEYESYWNTANTVNHSVLPYNDVDDDNPERTIAPPTRAEPPNFAPLYEKGMETAFNQMMMTSGQWQNEMGMMGNERTGRAIAERQEQSSTSVYHFQDNYESALKYTARQLIDLFPKVYDTKRVLMIQADDGAEQGTDLELEIDPGLQQAYVQETNHKGEVARRIFNPALGLYGIAPDVGPAAASKRRESVDALTLILTQAPALTGIIGDLLLKAMDFDEAQEAAQRLRRMVPPQALGQGPSQNEQMMQQLVQQLQTNLAKSLDAHGKDRVKLVGKDQMRDIDAYEAETNRMKALADMLPTDAGGLEQIIRQLVEDSLHTSLLPIIEANMKGIRGEGQSDNEDETTRGSATDQPPMPGAAKAPDGEWYIQDPTRKSKYLRIAPLAQERAPRGVLSNG